MATVNTTWVSPASATLDKSTGATIDETMTDAWSSNLYALGGTVGYIGCRAYNNANISIPNGAATAVTFNTELYDSDPNGAIHDTSSNTDRMTIRTAGLYHVVANVRFASNATGVRNLVLMHSSGATIASQHATPLSGSVHDLCVATSFFFQASEYVYATVFQNSGGALNLEAASYLPSLMVAKA